MVSKRRAGASSTFEVQRLAMIFKTPVNSEAAEQIREMQKKK
jgi:hypothetical protein